MMRSEEKVLNHLYSVEGCDLGMQGSYLLIYFFYYLMQGLCRWLTRCNDATLPPPPKTNMTMEKQPFEDVFPMSKMWVSIAMFFFGGVEK